MIVNDFSNSYTFGEYISWGVSGMMWNYGKEVWCNLEGQYAALVADLNHLS